ncbi:MAG: M20/M25/M40 family metallo-hydrolase [Coriobacteriia bacterium]|nr:M20/M25/M40 family metallo-hydrolase [Coriobacteriia bacterium]
MTKVKILTTSLIISLTACLLCACVAGPVKLEQSGYPNTIAENAKVSDKYKDVAQEISNNAIDEYMEMSDIPHRSEHETDLRNYLENWAKKNGFQPVEGPAGCMYFDVPATKGYENYPNIILQTHMDMVVTADETYKNIDPNSLSVSLVKDDKTGEVPSKDFHTSSGIDDGQGIGISLAIAKNKNIVHGPLRLLFTTTEEIGCMGSKFVPAEFLNADYLLNIDGSRTGEVFISSAGYMNANYTHTFNQTSTNDNMKFMDIEVVDLIGGHSGVDIAKPRKSGSAMCIDCMNKIKEIDPGFQIVSFDSGNAYNAISKVFSLKLAVSSANYNKAKDAINEVAENVKKECSEEKDFELNIKDMETSPAISNADSLKLTEILSKIPNGLIKMSEIQPDVPESSANIGFLKLDSGSLRIGVSARSNNEEYMKTLLNQFDQIGKDYNIDYKLIEDSVVPVWPSNGDNALSKLYLSGLKEQCNLEGYEVVIHGAVEPARFVNKHPGMLAITIGSDVKDEHMTSETWYTKSLPITVASTLHVLEKIKDIR